MWLNSSYEYKPMMNPDSEGSMSNFSSRILGAKAASPPMIRVSAQAPSTINE